MPIYSYKATNAAGEVIKDTYDAASEQEVLIYLRRNRLTPVGKPTRSILKFEISFGKPVKLAALVAFTRMLASLQKATVPLPDALKSLLENEENKALRRSIQKMIIDIESGKQFADSLRLQPTIFDEIYVSMVAAGENSGNLDVMLDRVAAFQERASVLSSKIKSALTYPVIVMFIGLAAVVTLLVSVIPAFADVFNSSNVPLPMPTQVALAMSKGLTDFWWLILGGVMALVAGMRMLFKRPAVQVWKENIILKVPVFGTIVKKGCTARFVRTLGTLISSGVSVIDALDMTAGTAGNLVFEQGIRGVRTAVMTGDSMAESLRRTKLFAPMVIQMFATGEQTGHLDELLDKIADFYERDVNDAVDRALKLLEPTMMVVLGGMVLGVLLAGYMPMFSMIKVIQNS